MGDFDEALHPRDHGKFAGGAGGSGPDKHGAAREKAAAKAKAVVDGAKAKVRGGGGKKPPLTKDQEIDKAFVHVARGEHDKAKALFDKHGMDAPANVRQMGTRAGFDYGKAPAPGSAPAEPPVAAARVAAKAKADQVVAEATKRASVAVSARPDAVAQARPATASQVTQPPAAAKPPSATGQHSDAHLAEVIHAGASAAPDESRFVGTNRVFSHALYNQMSTTDQAKFGSLDQFKDKLIDLNRKGLIEIGRVDGRGETSESNIIGSHISTDQRPGGKHRDDDFSYRGGVAHVVRDKSRKF